MKKEIESRLIELTVGINEMTTKLKPGTLSNHLSDQIIRSSSSAALNYGEVQSAESRKDFIHKNSLVLKELRETLIGLRIRHKSNSANDSQELSELMGECNHLTAIFQKTVSTSKSNMPRKS